MLTCTEYIILKPLYALETKGSQLSHNAKCTLCISKRSQSVNYCNIIQKPGFFSETRSNSSSLRPCENSCYVFPIQNGSEYLFPLQMAIIEQKLRIRPKDENQQEKYKSHESMPDNQNRWCFSVKPNSLEAPRPMVSSFVVHMSSPQTGFIHCLWPFTAALLHP